MILQQRDVFVSGVDTPCFFEKRLLEKEARSYGWLRLNQQGSQDVQKGLLARPQRVKTRRRTLWGTLRV